jgi:adenine deaminase
MSNTTGEQLIAVARGDAPGDLLLANGRIVNVFTSEIEESDVVLCEGRIAGIGRGYKAREVVDLGGAYLLPGFINGHTHIESSMLSIGQYARAVVARGTTSVVTDLHELANVAGLGALRRLLRDAARLPLDVFLMAPSCVPATGLETAGASIEPRDIAAALRWRNALGLGEVMNFPGVVSGDPHCLDKLRAAKGRPIDGHAPGLTGKGLNAYLAAGPRSDHESTSLEEGRDKLRRGMHLMIREGTSEKNLEELLPLVTDDTYPRCLLVVDDRSCKDLLHDGDIDAVVRKAVRLGLNPIRAIQLATINPATYFGLSDRGAIAPGFVADLIVADDLSDLQPRQVYCGGRLAASEGRALFSAALPTPRRLMRTFHIAPFSEHAFALKTSGRRLPVIEIIPGQIITRKLIEEVRVEDGRIVADSERDILKLAVVERHRPGAGERLRPQARGPRLLRRPRFAQRDRGGHQRSRHIRRRPRGGADAGRPDGGGRRTGAGLPGAAPGWPHVARAAGDGGRPTGGGRRSRRLAGGQRGRSLRRSLLPRPAGHPRAQAHR